MWRRRCDEDRRAAGEGAEGDQRRFADFARDLEEQQVDVVQLEWHPTEPEVDEEMKRLLEKLL